MQESRVNRDSLLRILLAVLAVALAAWLVSATEWVEEDVPTPARGEALKNRFYAVQDLLRNVGVKVTRKQSLDEMPPPRATLVLDSRHWTLFPDRADRLRKWVEGGGHLVLSSVSVTDKEFEDWLPVAEMSPKSRATRERPKAPEQKPGKPAPDAGCADAGETGDLPASYTGGRSFRLCTSANGSYFTPLTSEQTPVWTISAQDGMAILRLDIGKGSATVISPWGMLGNGVVLRADNPLVVAAALKATRGSETWFVVEEARAPLLKWLWHEAWIAVVLLLLALAAVLWRGAVRFGPLAAGTMLARRSMADQVSGTGQFLYRHGAAALHRAQVRALDEAARKYVRNYNARDLSASLEAIARATGLDQLALAAAITPRPAPADLPRHMELLETARRRLQLGATQRTSVQSPPSSPKP